MGAITRDDLVNFIIPKWGCLENLFFISICFMRPGGAGGEAKEKGNLKLVENSLQRRRY